MLYIINNLGENCQDGWDGLDMKKAHEGSEMCTQILQEDLRRRDHFADIEVNSIQEEIKSSLKLGNACYYSVQNLLASRLLSKTPRRYPYFDLVVGLEWSHGPESYAGGSVNYW